MHVCVEWDSVKALVLVELPFLGSLIPCYYKSYDLIGQCEVLYLDL